MQAQHVFGQAPQQPALLALNAAPPIIISPAPAAPQSALAQQHNQLQQLVLQAALGNCIVVHQHQQHLPQFVTLCAPHQQPPPSAWALGSLGSAGSAVSSASSVVALGGAGTTSWLVPPAPHVTTPICLTNTAATAAPAAPWTAAPPLVLAAGNTLPAVNTVATPSRAASLPTMGGGNPPTTTFHKGSPRAGSTSAYLGVTWYKASRRWQARLCVQNRKVHLGYFLTEEEAARAFDRAVIQHKGLHAPRNFADSADAFFAAGASPDSAAKARGTRPLTALASLSLSAASTDEAVNLAAATSDSGAHRAGLVGIKRPREGDPCVADIDASARRPATVDNFKAGSAASLAASGAPAEPPSPSATAGTATTASASSVAATVDAVACGGQSSVPAVGSLPIRARECQGSALVLALPPPPQPSTVVAPTSDAPKTLVLGAPSGPSAPGGVRPGSALTPLSLGPRAPAGLAPAARAAVGLTPLGAASQGAALIAGQGLAHVLASGTQPSEPAVGGLRLVVNSAPPSLTAGTAAAVLLAPSGVISAPGGVGHSLVNHGQPPATVFVYGWNNLATQVAAGDVATRSSS